MITRTRALAAVLLLIVAGSFGVGEAQAEVRSLQVVGVEPLPSGRRAAGVPRQRAVEQALWEGVSRVALDLQSEFSPTLNDATNQTLGNGTDAAEGDEDETETQLRNALGKDMTPYARSFRIVEDQGIRPALFSTEKGADNEYVVVVDVSVDVDRVRERMALAGLIVLEPEDDSGEGLRIELIGLTHWSGYEAFIGLLSGPDVGAESVRPLEFQRGRSVVFAKVSGSSEDVLERLLAAAPAGLQITPLGVDSMTDPDGAGIGSAERALRLAVKWSPPAKDEG